MWVATYLSLALCLELSRRWRQTGICNVMALPEADAFKNMQRCWKIHHSVFASGYLLHIKSYAPRMLMQGSPLEKKP